VATEQLIVHESELAKLEEQRVVSLENQATAIVTVVLAIEAFAASAVDGATLREHRVLIGIVVLLMLCAAGFAIAARGPRAIRARFWTRLLPGYAPLERRVADAEERLRGSASPDDCAVILESWRARRALSTYLAESKALWVTCSLICLLFAFITAGVVAVVVVS
jgi:hypothetical protein